MTMQAIPRGGYKQQPRRIPRSLGFAGYALSFDGTDDYVDAGNNPSLDITEAITLEAWIKPNTLAGPHQAIISKYTGISGTRGYEFALHGSRIRPGFEIGGVWYGNFFSSPISLAWTHIVVTYDGNVLCIYINGVQDVSFSEPSGAISTNTVSVCIGSRLGGNFFNGLIDEARIYNRALSAKEIKWNMLNYHNPICSGLRLWLPIEEGAGEVIYDKSGYGNNGILLPAGAGPTWKRLRQWELRAAVE